MRRAGGGAAQGGFCRVDWAGEVLGSLGIVLRLDGLAQAQAEIEGAARAGAISAKMARRLAAQAAGSAPGGAQQLVERVVKVRAGSLVGETASKLNVQVLAETTAKTVTTRPVVVTRPEHS